MRHIDAQLDLLNAYLRYKDGLAARGPVQVPFGPRKVIAIMPSGTVGYVLSKDKTALNLAYFETLRPSAEFTKQLGKGEELHETGLLREVKGKNVPLYESIYGTIGIDPRLLRNFSKDAKLSHTALQGVITVTEDDKIVGVVYPIRVQQ